MFTPYHLIKAREWARQEGYELVRSSLIRDFSCESTVSHYDLRSYPNPARFLDTLAVNRTRTICDHMRTREAFVETIGSDPDSRFKVYRSTARIIMPG